MNSINTGKQQTAYNWEDSLKTSQIPSAKNSPLPSKPSSQPLTYKETRIPVMDVLETDSFWNIEPSRIHNEAYIDESTPLLDKLSPDSPKEPSLIFKSPINSSSSAFKHPYETSSSDQNSGLPVKRAKFENRNLEIEQLLESFDLKESSSIDFNTVNGSNLVDFWFTHRTSSEVINMEESERAERVKNGADPVLLGKFYLIQKEFMKSSQLSSAFSEKKSSIVNSLSDSLSDMKNSIMEKGEKLMESSKEVFNVGSLKQAMDEIVQEADASRTFGRFEPYFGENIDFHWPRVPAYIKDLEEQARSERIASGADAIIYGKMKLVNAEIKKKMESSGFAYMKNATIGLAEQAAKTFNFAKHFTSEILNFSQLKIKEEVEEKDLEWFRLQEEMERARRINQESVDSNVDFNKRQVERQLLKSVKAL